MTDHQAITELVYSYALGVDTRNWDRYRSIFADEVFIDFSSYSGQPASTMRADDWLRRLQRLFPGLAATQHVMTNPIVRVDGDRATCSMYVVAEHMLDPVPNSPSFALGGYYNDSFVRTSAGWLIDGVTLTVLWRRGDESIMTEAMHRAASR